ncbi:hypothetical protein [Marinobacterium stanieri]|uniref:hypothetical protein n=1 Tax=Marinobacterium stanieri TaxID=49186 RepID=UPI00025588AF|nr:hypothetical protein [Marinobacterium stanieri]
MTSKQEKYSIWRNLHETEGNLAYHLAVFGDHIAEREGYKDLEGIDAIVFYLVHKFSWPVSQVRSMPYEDIRFILSQEMNGWKVPVEAR